MFLIICYAVHSRTVASVDKRETLEDACDFLKKDAKHVYAEEIESCDVDPNDVTLEIRDYKAIVEAYNGEFCWTWEILEE